VRRERELDAAAQVQLAQPRRLRNRQTLIVDEIAILRILARLRPVEAADDARPRREPELDVHANGWCIEIPAVDGQRALDERLQIALRAREHPAASKSHHAIGGTEQKVGRRLLSGHQDGGEHEQC
jgi:hypothetical protein